MIYPVGMTNYLSLDEEVIEQSDEKVLALSMAHPSLFTTLVRKYEHAFMRKAMSVIRDEVVAQDIVQEAFVKIYLNAGKFKKQEGASFSSWGYRILINTALTHYMKRKREGKVRMDLEPEILELIPDKNLRQFEKKEFMDEVASVLTRMSPLFASVLSAFFIEGKSQEEIAELEGVTVGAIKTRVHRAKSEFRKIYKIITTTV